MNRLLACTVLLGLALPVAAAEPSAFDDVLARVQEHSLVLVGEIHGTAEVPALVGDLAEHLAGAARPLRVALEIPATEQESIDDYLRSAGISGDRQRLLARAFWQRDYQDGRSSVAMLGLIERLRQLMLKADVRVVAFDIDATRVGDDAKRETVLAQNLAAAVNAEPNARWLTLTGNLHSRVNAGAPWDEHFSFMGHRLESLAPYAIEILPVAGSAWTCTDADAASCKSRPFPSSTRQPGLQLGSEINERGHHGWWLLDASTASPPAITESEQP
jgi:hypothetical protein